MNHGLKESPGTNISIYSDNELIDNFEIQHIKPGQGRTMILQNIYVKKRNFESITFEINGNFKELEKKNNKIKLEVSV